MDVAFDKMKEVAPRLAGFYGLTSDAQSKFQQGIADIATWYSRTVQRLRADGIPLQFQTPEEGAFVYPVAFQAIKGTPKLDLVEKLIGQFYDPASLRRSRAAERLYPGQPQRECCRRTWPAKC